MKKLKLGDRTYSVHRKVFYHVRNLENANRSLDIHNRLLTDTIKKQDKIILKKKEIIYNLQAKLDKVEELISKGNFEELKELIYGKRQR